MEMTTAKERLSRWHDICNRRTIHRNSSSVRLKRKGEETYFDCSDLVIPSSTDLVQKELEKGVARWKELDSRCIVDETNIIPIMPTNEDRSGKGAGYRNKRPRRTLTHEGDSAVMVEDGGDRDNDNLNWGCHANRLRLPLNFDVTCQGDGPPEDSSCKRRVISLFHQETTNYETELWHIFKSIPTVEELEQANTQGTVCTNILNVKKEITEGLKIYTRLDAHALGRMRSRDRHHIPLTVSTEQTKQNHYNDVTLRIECWRKDLKRGSSKDNNRLEMEFLGEQTLLDVHRAIIMCANDLLFKQPTDIPKEQSSGLFFIEDTFYPYGNVDYVSPIVEWLDGKNDDSDQQQKLKPENIQIPRRDYLGIPNHKQINIKPMEQTRLDSIPIRIGVRYMHVFHGDCECALFFSDVRLRHSNEIYEKYKYPLIHDTWNTCDRLQNCTACNQIQAAVVIVGDKLTNKTHTPLCPPCFQRLHYNKDGTYKEDPTNQFQVFPFELLQNYTNVTVGHDPPDAFFYEAK